MIQPISNWVISTAFAQASVWHADGVDVEIAVNLPPVLWQTALVQQLSTELETHGLDAAKVLIEVTESAAMTDPDRTERVMAELPADRGDQGQPLGVRLADVGGEELDGADGLVADRDREGERRVQADAGGVADAAGARHGRNVGDPDRLALRPGPARDAGAAREPCAPAQPGERAGVDLVGAPDLGAAQLIGGRVDQPDGS